MERAKFSHRGKYLPILGLAARANGPTSKATAYCRHRATLSTMSTFMYVMLKGAWKKVLDYKCIKGGGSLFLRPCIRFLG
jgi:hypothetical protein